MESGKCNAPCQEASGGYTEKCREQVSEIKRKSNVACKELLLHNDLHGPSLLELPRTQVHAKDSTAGRRFSRERLLRQSRGSNSPRGIS
jgi:hypothetical protein